MTMPVELPPPPGVTLEPASGSKDCTSCGATDRECVATMRLRGTPCCGDCYQVDTHGGEALPGVESAYPWGCAECGASNAACLEAICSGQGPCCEACGTDATHDL